MKKPIIGTLLVHENDNAIGNEKWQCDKSIKLEKKLAIFLAFVFQL